MSELIEQKNNTDDIYNKGKKTLNNSREHIITKLIFMCNLVHIILTIYRTDTIYQNFSEYI